MLYEKLLNISEAAKLLGVSPSTLRRLERDGIVEGYGLKVIYTPGGQRRYILDEVQQLYMNQGFSGKIGFGKKPALLVRDLTIAFLEPHSYFSIIIDQQIEITKQLIKTANLHSIPVIFSSTIYDPDVKSSYLWSQKFPSLQILKSDSHWTRIHPELEHLSFDLMNKTPYITDFYQSPVNSFLEKYQVDTIILAGATTSGSIRSTAVDALQQGYHVIVPREAVGDRNYSLQTSTLLDLNARYADVLNASQVLDYFATFDHVQQTSRTQN